MVVLNLNHVGNSFCLHVTMGRGLGYPTSYIIGLPLYEGAVGLPSAWQSGIQVPAHQMPVILSIHWDNQKHSPKFPKPSLGGSIGLTEKH